ncbi:11600_t:CDS:2, partial [Rhizophagus irregularis]
MVTCSLWLSRWDFEKDAEQTRKELPRQMIIQISLNWEKWDVSDKQRLRFVAEFNICRGIM